MTAKGVVVGQRKRIVAGPIAEWRDRALCRDADKYDPEMFHPFARGAAYASKAEEAKEVCRACPVTAACLQWALEAPNALEGIWGATTEAERTQMIRDRKREQD